MVAMATMVAGFVHRAELKSLTQRRKGRRGRRGKDGWNNDCSGDGGYGAGFGRRMDRTSATEGRPTGSVHGASRWGTYHNIGRDASGRHGGRRAAHRTSLPLRALRPLRFCVMLFQGPNERRWWIWPRWWWPCRKSDVGHGGPTYGGWNRPRPVSTCAGRR